MFNKSRPSDGSADILRTAPSVSSNGAQKSGAGKKEARKHTARARRGGSKAPLPLWFSLTLLALAIAACFAIRAIDLPNAPEGELQVHFIDVGQGDAALLVTSENAVMIDAGPTSARYYTSGFVADRVGAIDLMILTHPHEDHVGGAAQILESVPVAKVMMPDVTSTAGAFVRALDAVEKSGAAAVIAEPGDVYDVGGMRVTVLAPLSTDHDDLNDSSVVVRVDYGRRSFLFTGDAEQVSEREMLGAYPAAALDCDVLKVGHHGSESSSCADFLDAVRPRIAVISVGRQNDYGHPESETLDRLRRCKTEQILRTDEAGTVTLVCDGESVRVKD